MCVLEIHFHFVVSFEPFTALSCTGLTLLLLQCNRTAVYSLSFLFSILLIVTIS